MQEIRDRLTTLETKHEERHNQSLLLINRIEQTQERIAGAVENLVENQSKMSHLIDKTNQHESVISDHAIQIETLKTKQNVIWRVLGAIGTAITAVTITAAFKMWG